MNQTVSILLLATLIDCSGAIAYWHHMNRNMDASPSLSAAEPSVAVVFYAGSLQTSMPRIEAAIELYHQNKVEHLLMLGGSRPSKAHLGSKEMVETAINRGIPPNDSSHDLNSFDTISNLKSICPLLEASELQFEHAIFISDGLHLDRIHGHSAHVDCVASLSSIPVPAQLSFVQQWYRVHLDWLARSAYLLLSEDDYLQTLRHFRG